MLVNTPVSTAELPLYSALTRIKQEQISGALTVKTATESWTVYTYLGRVLYATGGTASTRRWYACIRPYLPTVDDIFAAIAPETLQDAVPDSKSCLEYQLLCYLGQQEHLSRDVLQACVSDLSHEALFEMANANAAHLSFDASANLIPRLLLLNVAELLPVVEQQRSRWQDLIPQQINAVPVLSKPELLRSQVSEAMFGQWQKLLSSQLTVRELGRSLNKESADVARLLLPLVRQGIVTLTPPPATPLPLVPQAVTESVALTPLIACIDDSEIICESMRQLLTSEGYRFVGIQDPIRAIAQLLKEPPNLIFLDLVMPTANGYEICTQLRRIPRFKTIPIIILTGNDGILDRVRAKFVGSNHYMTKPVNKVELLDTVQLQLAQANAAF